MALSFGRVTGVWLGPPGAAWPGDQWRDLTPYINVTPIGSWYPASLWELQDWGLISERERALWETRLVVSAWIAKNCPILRGNQWSPWLNEYGVPAAAVAGR